MSSFDEEKNKPIEGFDIAYSDEELEIAKELAEGAKRLNKAITDAMHDKLINSNKEQEKMKKYEINLQEVATDLREYLNDYNIYTEVNKDNSDVCVRLHNYDAPYVVILHWNDEADIKWTERWEVQTVCAKYYINRSFMTVYDLGCFIQDIDRFLTDWYGDNEEPEPDMKRDLPQVIKGALLEVYNSDALDIHVTIATNSLGDNFINLAIKSTYTYSMPSHEEYEPREQLVAKYLIKDRSAFVVDMRTFNEFLTKSEEINTIVRKCVMEWDK